MNNFKKAAVASALALLACGSASAATITFDDFASQAGYGYLPFVTYAHSSYTEDGFTFASSGGVPGPNHTTIVTLLSLDQTLSASSLVTTTLTNGSNFSLSSIDLDVAPRVNKTVTFTGITAAGLTVSESFDVQGGFLGSSTTFNFTVPGFADVKSVSWTQGKLPTYAVDNVVLAAVPEPETYAMLLAGLGLVGFMARRKKSA